MLEPGARMPDVGADDDTGEPVSLRDLGKTSTLVVYFYPKANTPGCTNETIQFTELSSKFKRKGVQIVGVSRDSVKAQANFKAKYGVTFPLLADVDSQICDAFGVIVEKSNYGKKYMGIQRSTFLIEGNKVTKVWPKVKVEGHAAEVLSSL